eukprot:scaffold133_cov407-Prasinococcus_capsulatus_cf.AAC.9
MGSASMLRRGQADFCAPVRGWKVDGASVRIVASLRNCSASVTRKRLWQQAAAEASLSASPAVQPPRSATPVRIAQSGNGGAPATAIYEDASWTAPFRAGASWGYCTTVMRRATGPVVLDPTLRLDLVRPANLDKAPAADAMPARRPPGETHHAWVRV